MRCKSRPEDPDQHIRLRPGTVKIRLYSTASNYESGPETGPAFRAKPVRVLNFWLLAHKKLLNDRICFQKLNQDLRGLICVRHVIVRKKSTTVPFVSNQYFIERGSYKQQGERAIERPRERAARADVGRVCPHVSIPFPSPTPLCAA
jgi:hypothetical protein